MPRERRNALPCVVPSRKSSLLIMISYANDREQEEFSLSFAFLQQSEKKKKTNKCSQISVLLANTRASIFLSLSLRLGQRSFRVNSCCACLAQTESDFSKRRPIGTGRGQTPFDQSVETIVAQCRTREVDRRRFELLIFSSREQSGDFS